MLISYFYVISAPPPPPARNKQMKLTVKEELPAKFKVKIPPQKTTVAEPREPQLYIESYYYGIFENGTENDAAQAVQFEADVSAGSNLVCMQLSKI